MELIRLLETGPSTLTGCISCYRDSGTAIFLGNNSLDTRSLMGGDLFIGFKERIKSLVFFLSLSLFFSLELWLVRLSNIFIIRFTVALPLIFLCIIMIIFCFNYFNWGSPFLISPVASLGLPRHESLNNFFSFSLYNLWQTNNKQ